MKGFFACLLVASGVLVAPQAHAESELDDARLLLRSGQKQAATEVLKALWPDLAGDERDVARYILGTLQVQAGDREAWKHFDSLPRPFGVAEQQRLVWESRAHVVAGRGLAASQAVTALEDSFPKADALPELRIELARWHASQARISEALEVLDQLLDERPTAHIHSEVLLLKADLLRPTDVTAAEALESKLRVRFPGSEAAQRFERRESTETLNRWERFVRAERLMKDWHYEEAREELRRLIALGYRPQQARWRLGQIGLNKLRDAASEAREAFKDVPKEFREEALFYTLRTYLKEDDYARAEEVADVYDETYPKGTFSDRVAFYRVWMPFDHRDCKRALPRIRSYLKAFTQRQTLVRVMRARCYVRMKRWRWALNAWRGLQGASKRLIRGQALYWQAVALNELERREEGQQKLTKLIDSFPLSYYGILGAQLRARWQGDDPRASAVAWPEGGGQAAQYHRREQTMWELPRLKGVLAEQWRAVRRLVYVGEFSAARQRYMDIAARVEAGVPQPQRLAFMHFIAHEIEDHHRPFNRIGAWRKSSLQGVPDPKDIRSVLAYPRAYEPLVSQLAQQYGLATSFVWAVMRQESHYAPGAISHADAVGALQMIPPTARECARAMGVPYEPRRFTDPRHGFPFSFYYLARHQRLWKGQLMCVAASYNAGPRPVAEWLSENAPAPLVDLVDEFAYREARDYSRLVAEHALRYLYLYEDDPTARGQVLDALFPVDVDYQVSDDIGF